MLCSPPNKTYQNCSIFCSFPVPIQTPRGKVGSQQEERKQAACVPLFEHSARFARLVGFRRLRWPANIQRAPAKTLRARCVGAKKVNLKAAKVAKAARSKVASKPLRSGYRRPARRAKKCPRKRSADTRPAHRLVETLKRRRVRSCSKIEPSNIQR